MARSYDQYCPVAAALDVVGDRWTLLIMRELVAGDRRFTDLRDRLPGIAPNLLPTACATSRPMGSSSTRSCRRRPPATSTRRLPSGAS